MYILSHSIQREKIMGGKADSFCHKIQCQLDSIHDTIANAISCVDSAQNEELSKSTLHQKIQDAHQKYEQGKQKAKESKCQPGQAADMNCEKILELQSQVEQWKKEHEVKQLKQHAKQVEQYAQAAFACATAAVEEADFAMLEAIQARMVAEEAAETVPSM